MTAASIQALSLGLWATSIHSMMSRAFFAKKDAVTPTLIGLASLIIGATSSLLLMGTPAHVGGSAFEIAITDAQAWLVTFLPSGSYGHVGLSYASSISATTSVLLSLAIISRAAPGTTFRPFLITTLKTTLASVAAAYAALLVPQEWPAFPRLVAMSVVGASTLLLTLKVLRSGELSEVARKMRSLRSAEKRS